MNTFAIMLRRLVLVWIICAAVAGLFASVYTIKHHADVQANAQHSVKMALEQARLNYTLIPPTP